MVFRLGIDNIETNELKGSVGIITNSTGVTGNIEQNIDYLTRKNVKLNCIFSLEHGFYGTYNNGEIVPDETYNHIPVKSLYKSDTRDPDRSLFEEFDTIIFDVQDAGVRHYTYISTLYKVMTTMKPQKGRLLVLDRPNPIRSDIVDGPVLLKEFSSFVGIKEIPTRYGMTIGELSRLFDEEIGSDVKVVEMSGYSRDTYLDDLMPHYIPMSLNLPSVSAAINYSGMCFLEGINMSLGRGTPYPFLQIGSPFLWDMNLKGTDGLTLRRTEFTPLLDPFRNQRVGGYYLHITDRDSYNPLKFAIETMIEAYRHGRIEINKRWLGLLYGSNKLISMIEEGNSAQDIVNSWQDDLRLFRESRENFLLYR
ncbi:MAG: DUF1343 domain-containing protein [Candidatus Thermoplasmatota archaeon]|nr:DUF1343 domain-containing protein [Candidatus Thermoplasmatota archaeon]